MSVRNRHRTPLAMLAARLSPDAKQVHIVDQKSIGTWDVATGKRLTTHAIAVPEEQGAQYFSG